MFLIEIVRDFDRGCSKAIRLALFSALGFMMTGMILTAPVQAQAIKPLDVEKDRNGVDLLSGKTSTQMPTLSIPAVPSLTFTKLQDFQPIMTGKLNDGGYGGYSSSSYQINDGGSSSQSFACTVDGCQSKKGNGSVLFPDPYGGVFYYTQAGSGKRFRFDLQNNQQGFPAAGSEFIYYPTLVDLPNGETLTWQYDTHSASGSIYRRPSAVVSNLGYTLVFSYQTSIYGIGWTTLTEARIVKSDTPSVPLARLTYSGSTITDLAGRVYTCNGCSNGLGGQSSLASFSTRLPGDTQDVFVATAEARQYGQYIHANFTTDVDTAGVHYGYSYIAGANPISTISQATITAPAGFQRIVNIIHTDTRPQLSTIQDSLGNVTSYEYDNSGRPTKITLPEGNAVSVQYDLSGNIVEMRQMAIPGSGLADIVQSASFNTMYECDQIACWLPIWTKDAKGQQTDYTWATHGGLLTRLDPADANGQRRKTINEYDAGAGVYRPIRERVCAVSSAGANLTCGTADEFVKQTTYWGSTFLPLTETLTDGVGSQSLTTTYSYDAAGRVLSVDGPMPGSADTAYTRYDVIGQKTGTIAPDPDGAGALGRPATRITYDLAGRVIKQETGELADVQPETVAPVGWTGFNVLSSNETAYDVNGRKITETAKGSDGIAMSVQQLSYDARGRADCATTRMNAAAFGSLPASACTLGTPGAFGKDRIARTVYDAESRVLKLQKAVGTALQQDYATYTYSANGKQLTVKDANGNLASMTWDGFDRQTRWNFPSKTTPGVVSTTDYEAYGYDANGNRTSLRKRDGSTFTYAYDALNRMTVKVVPERTGLAATHTRDVYYGYDLRGLQTYARFDGPSGEGLTMSYDGFGRMASNTLAMDGVSRTLSYQYDANGNRTRITHPDGALFDTLYDGLNRVDSTYQGTTISPVLFGYAYNSRGSLRALNHRYGNNIVYDRDAAGRVTGLSQAFNGGTGTAIYQFQYTPASQLASETRDNDAYAWTGHVNVDRGYTANGLNQYASAGSAAFTYDANGNLTSDGTTTYLYDIENRLVSASGGTTATLRYDPLGRLYETGGTAGTTRLLYDGDALVAEYDGSGTLLRRYVHGGGVDNPLVWYEGSAVALSAARYIHADRRGSIVAVADSAGANMAINAYDEYGIPGATNLGRFQYTGQAWIPEIGMYYYKARIYSPTLGRFLQTDPIGYEDQVNLYAYVGNDPLNAKDPSGNQTVPGTSGMSPEDWKAAGNAVVDWVKRDPIGAAIDVATVVLVAVDIADGPTPDVGAAAVAARTARAERMAQNAAQGRRGEAATAAKLGDKTAGRQVTFKTSDGTRTRADFVTKDKGVVETKTGGAQLRKGQAKLHDDIRAGREVTPVGRNAQDAGLRPGEPTRMKSCSVDRPCL